VSICCRGIMPVSRYAAYLLGTIFKALSSPCSQVFVCVCIGLSASDCHGAVTNSAQCFFCGADVEALDSPKVVEDVVYETGKARCLAPSVLRITLSASVALPPRRFAECVGPRAQRRSRALLDGPSSSTASRAHTTCSSPAQSTRCGR